MSCRTRCWPHGRAWTGSRDARQSVPGPTVSRPTGASTRSARPADDLPSHGMLRGSNRPNRRSSARSCGWSHIQTRFSSRCPTAHSPGARHEQNEAVSLAFVITLQALPARQRAVLILRDVLGYRAREVANLLDTTVESVNSALKRARATLHHRLPRRGDQEPPAPPDSPAEQALAAKLTRAFRAGDVDALVALITDDVVLSMPPIPLEYRGRDAVANFYAGLMGRGHRYDLVPTRANGQLAFGAYLHAGNGGIRHCAGLVVLTLTGDRVCALTRFGTSVLPCFGLPRSLPG